LKLTFPSGNPSSFGIDGHKVVVALRYLFSQYDGKLDFHEATSGFYHTKEQQDKQPTSN